ncbi:ExbD/TolR family protein [Kordiimonas marina]|uniref:ExbD/TolR family protein n=1 Tax=Kordiimonas marina TaxID=2872312 RepID=UPI00248CA625|nr:biopolymer transporter ExbD [Kordiimonas marina]MCJ9428438.1 biopolymer transporter ExbD [Kordiimonas marina]
MRDHAQKQGDEAEIDLTPMLDVVFIMLIFFIVTAVFVKEAGVSVIEPEAHTAVIQRQVSILVAVRPNDEIWINRHKVELAGVRTAIEKLHAENPKGSVAIQADKKSKAGLVMKVYDAVRAAGVEKIAIAAEKI